MKKLQLVQARIINIFNYSDLLIQKINDILVFNGKNGSGKSVAMTALAQLLLADFREVVSLGRSKKSGRRDPKAWLTEGTPSYITHEYTNGKKTISLVAYIALKPSTSGGTTIDQKFAIINRPLSMITLLDNKNQPLDWTDFRNLNKTDAEYISKQNSTLTEYRDALYSYLFGCNDRKVYETFIKQLKIFLAPVMTDTDEKGGAGGDLMSELNDKLASLFKTFDNMDDLATEIYNYIKGSIENEQKLSDLEEIKTNLATYNYRSVAQPNRKVVKDELTKNVSEFNAEINNTEERIKQLNTEIREFEELIDSKERTQKETTALNLELEENVNKLEQLKSESDLNRLLNDKESLQKRIDKLSKELSDNNKKLESHTEKYKTTKNRVDKLFSTKDEKERNLNHARDEVSLYDADKELFDVLTKIDFDNQLANFEKSSKIDDEIKAKETLKGEAQNNLNQTTTDINESEKKIKDEELRLTNVFTDFSATYSISIQEYSNVNELIDNTTEAISELIARNNKNIGKLTNKITKCEELKEEKEAARTKLENETEPDVSDRVRVTDGKLLYEVIEFEDNTSEKDRKYIETMLSYDNVLLTILEHNEVEKGLYVCKTN